jgi:hypothetical protein
LRLAELEKIRRCNALRQHLQVLPLAKCVLRHDEHRTRPVEALLALHVDHSHQQGGGPQRQLLSQVDPPKQRRQQLPVANNRRHQPCSPIVARQAAFWAKVGIIRRPVRSEAPQRRNNT